MRNPKIFVVGPSIGYANWMEGSITREIEECDFVLFTGGEDVDPHFASETHRHPTLHTNISRDIYEHQVFVQAQNLNKKKVGICRGAQLLCALSGGKLVRDMSNPYSIHKVQLYDGRVIDATSSHHNAMYPWNLKENEYEVLGWTQGISRYHDGEDGKEIVNEIVDNNKECEIVLFRNTDSLGIQMHPEWMHNDSRYEDSMRVYKEILNLFLSDSI